MKCEDTIVSSLSKDKGVPLQVMDVCKWRGGKAPLILNLRTRWRQLVSFEPRLLYAWEEGGGTPVSIE